jgi:hypothetical protein
VIERLSLVIALKPRHNKANIVYWISRVRGCDHQKDAILPGRNIDHYTPWGLADNHCALKIELKNTIAFVEEGVQARRIVGL